MIVTPAEFEDKMQAADSFADAVALMLLTLDSMGYGAGTNMFFSKFMEHDLLHGSSIVNK